MKRSWILFLMIVLTASLSGCVTVRKVVRERVDQDVTGNQGYLLGSPEANYEARPTEREYIDIRVEVPTWDEVTAPAVRYEDIDKDAEGISAPIDESVGNKGYMETRQKTEKAEAYGQQEQEYEHSETTAVYEYDYYEMDVIDEEGDVLVYEEEIVKPVYQEYTIQQGDTLSHIAHAFYNKASKWTVIYEANSDKIKDPSKLKPGTKIKIPPLQESESRYVK
jgi:LysM repeat protein